MARGRKAGAAIKCITSRDLELMTGIAKTGLTSYYDAIQTIGLSEKRLKNLEKEGYISSKNVLIKGNDIFKTYCLNSKGKTYIKINTDIDKFYRSNERQVEHDLKLSSIYYRLERDERKTWTNENDLIDSYKLNHPGKKLKTMVDATYSSTNGCLVAVEVITRNYTKEQIQEKYKIAEQLGCTEVLKINA